MKADFLDNTHFSGGPHGERGCTLRQGKDTAKAPKSAPRQKSGKVAANKPPGKTTKRPSDGKKVSKVSVHSGSQKNSNGRHSKRPTVEVAPVERKDKATTNR